LFEGYVYYDKDGSSKDVNDKKRKDSTNATSNTHYSYLEEK
jgi:hypothetical protein